MKGLKLTASGEFVADLLAGLGILTAVAAFSLIAYLMGA